MKIKVAFTSYLSAVLLCFSPPVHPQVHAIAPALAIQATNTVVPVDNAVPGTDRYKVQPEDSLVVSFALSPELNQTVGVQPDGYVSLLSVGGVYVKDLTVPQVVQAIKKAYAGTLHDPIVDVDLKDSQRPVFYVSGQVSKPGQYDLRYQLSVMQAIAIGGGLSQTAKTQVVLMHRVSNEWAEVKVLNLRKVIHGQALENDMLVKPGDMIFVPEKIIVGFRKYVPYGLGLSFSPANNNILY